MKRSLNVFYMAAAFFVSLMSVVSIIAEWLFSNNSPHDDYPKAIFRGAAGDARVEVMSFMVDDHKDVYALCKVIEPNEGLIRNKIYYFILDKLTFP